MEKGVRVTTGTIPKAFCDGVLVLLVPKSTPGEYRGLALLEMLYKLISTILLMIASMAFELEGAQAQP